MARILAEGYAFAIAPGYARAVAGRYVIPAMKIVEDVRRERLRMLKEEFGTLSALNDKLGLGARDSTLSQYLNQSKSSGSDKPKVMGSPMARRLEQACGKEAGWMDTDPALTGESGGLVAIQEFQALRDKVRAEVLAELAGDDQRDVPLTAAEIREAEKLRFSPGKKTPKRGLRPPLTDFSHPPKRG